VLLRGGKEERRDRSNELGKRLTQPAAPGRFAVLFREHYSAQGPRAKEGRALKKAAGLWKGVRFTQERRITARK